MPLAEVARRAPEKTSVREALGRAYFRNRQFAEAATEFEAVIESPPGRRLRPLLPRPGAEQDRRARPRAPSSGAGLEPAPGAQRLPPLPRPAAPGVLAPLAGAGPAGEPGGGPVEAAEVAAIGPGLLVLLGVAVGDGDAEADRLADKIRALRVFEDAAGRMNEPLGEREVLCVSQFTLSPTPARATARATSAPPRPSSPSRCTSASASGSARSAASSAPGWRSSSSTTAR